MTKITVNASGSTTLRKNSQRNAVLVATNKLIENDRRQHPSIESIQKAIKKSRAKALNLSKLQVRNALMWLHRAGHLRSTKWIKYAIIGTC